MPPPKAKDERFKAFPDREIPINKSEWSPASPGGEYAPAPGKAKKPVPAYASNLVRTTKCAAPLLAVHARWRIMPRNTYAEARHAAATRNMHRYTHDALRSVAARRELHTCLYTCLCTEMNKLPIVPSQFLHISVHMFTHAPCACPFASLCAYAREHVHAHVDTLVRYTALNSVPKTLFEQFRQLAVRIP